MISYQSSMPMTVSKSQKDQQQAFRKDNLIVEESSFNQPELMTENGAVSNKGPLIEGDGTEAVKRVQTQVIRQAG